jgi:VanZ family protein
MTTEREAIRRRTVSHARTWLPPLAWMAVVWWLSSAQWSAEQTGSVLIPALRWLLPWATGSQIATMHALARKLAHFTEYGILAALWNRAFARGAAASSATAGWAALATSVAWALVDEAHQSTIPTRTGSLVDVGIDGAGAVAAVIATRAGWGRAIDGATTALFALTGFGGVVVLGIDWAAHVGSGPLWVTTPVAILVWLLRRRRASDGHGR